MCVKPETMKLLIELAGHRKVCEDCHNAFTRNDGSCYCKTGELLFLEIIARPDVEVVN